MRPPLNVVVAANIELHAVALQRRRLRSSEPEDEQFVMRWWTDLGFLIVSLIRLRRAAGMASRTRYASDELRPALSAFDAVTPSLRTIAMSESTRTSMPSIVPSAISRRSIADSWRLARPSYGPLFVSWPRSYLKPSR
jgi:hypothetical protein